MRASLYLGIDDGSHEDPRAHHRQRVDEEGRRAAARTRRQFNAACNKRDLPRVRKPARADTASARFLVRLGETAEQVPDEAKLAELIVFAAHWAHYHQVFPSLLDNVLLESGVPALCCPDAPIAIPPRRIVITWDGSVQAARTVRATTNFLAKADAIRIVSIEEGGAASRDPHGVGDYLGWRGLEAEARIG